MTAVHWTATGAMLVLLVVAFFASIQGWGMPSTGQTQVVSVRASGYNAYYGGGGSSYYHHYWSGGGSMGGGMSGGK